MAKLDGKEAKEGSNYFMIFNDVDLGKLMSKMHSTVIRTGNELENVIKEKASKMMIEDLSVFLASSKSGTYVLTKKTISCIVVIRSWLVLLRFSFEPLYNFSLVRFHKCTIMSTDFITIPNMLFNPIINICHRC